MNGDAGSRAPGPPEAYPPRSPEPNAPAASARGTESAPRVALFASRVRAGVTTAAHGLALFALSLPGLIVSLLVVGLTLPGPGLAIYGFGSHHANAGLARLVAVPALVLSLFLATRLMLVLRPMARLTRRLSTQWCGVPIADPYLPHHLAETAPDAGARPAALAKAQAQASWRRRQVWLLTDPATWRDLLWGLLNGCVGGVLALLPAGLLVLGVLGVVAPYASPDLRVGLVALAAAEFWAAPWLARGYGLFTRSMLAPTRQAGLALQVQHLAQTRTEALDTGAAEIRRIERDLHDGAQARLVAMGMTLDAAGQVMDTNPDAARALLAEARDSSVKALAELRALVRGIHPPVLADRGLADAIRALALDSPMRIRLASDLHGRPPEPVESAAYFAVSELLANVSKHAEARETWIDIRYTDGMLRVGVTDNGHGGADPAQGTGLRGIERRLAAFDGILAISSPPGGPTAVTMEIPCELSLPKTSSY